MLNDIMPNVIMLSVVLNYTRNKWHTTFMLSVTCAMCNLDALYSECHYAECRVASVIVKEKAWKYGHLEISS